MPYNILLTSWYTGLGGGETDLLSLADGIDPNRFRLHLFVPRNGQLPQRWRERGLPVHIVPYRGATTYFIPQIWTRFPIASHIAEIVRRENITLIAANYHTLPFAVGAARQTNIPIQWTVHGWWFRPKVWQRDFFRQIPVVARSQSIRDGFLGEPPFMPPQAVPVIYSGVDTNRFMPNVDVSPIYELNQIDQNKRIVAMVARFQSVKGHHTFQDMAKIVMETIPDVQFVVAGEDIFGVGADADYKRRILQTAQDNPILHQHLHYIGFRDDVERLMVAADVVVCASDFESYGKVNLEAMATGTPIVSTNRGGPAETVLDGVTGYLVPPNNPEALASKVIALLNHPQKAQQMGQVGRDHILENFSLQTYADAYMQHFQSLMTKH